MSDTFCSVWIHYISGQEEHHRTKSFQEEYLGFLGKHGDSDHLLTASFTPTLRDGPIWNPKKPVLKRRPIFKASLRDALEFGHFGKAKAGEIRKFSLVEIFCWSRKAGACNDLRKWSHYTFRAVS